MLLIYTYKLRGYLQQNYEWEREELAASETTRLIWEIIAELRMDVRINRHKTTNGCNIREYQRHNIACGIWGQDDLIKAQPEWLTFELNNHLGTRSIL